MFLSFSPKWIHAVEGACVFAISNIWMEGKNSSSLGQNDDSTESGTEDDLPVTELSPPDMNVELIPSALFSIRLLGVGWVWDGCGNGGGCGPGRGTN